MKLFETLTEENFNLYAANNYRNKQCTDVEEFYDDLNRFKYIKRLLSRYEQNNELQERLLLNHLVVLYNVFGIEAATRMIWYRIPKKFWPVIKPMLLYLNCIEESTLVEVPMDPIVVERLRKI